MTEFNIQAGGEGPMNHSYDPQTGQWTDHGSKIGPDGSVHNVIGGGGMDGDEYTVPDEAPFAQGQETPSPANGGPVQTIRTEYHGPGGSVVNEVHGNVSGDVKQYPGDVEGGVHF